MRFKIVRFFQRPDLTKKTIRRGLTLEEAQAHCNDPESSSATCTTKAGKRRTKVCGPWFDGYTQE